jgi:hypothetical protein
MAALGPCWPLNLSQNAICKPSHPLQVVRRRALTGAGAPTAPPGLPSMPAAPAFMSAHQPDGPSSNRAAKGKSIGLRRVHHGTPLLSFLQAKEGCARVTRYYYSRRSGCDIEEGCVCKKSRRTGSSAADSQPVVQERFGTLGRYVRGRRRGRWALHRRLQKMLKKKWFLCVAILQPAEHATVPARHHIPRRDSGGCLAVLARVCCCCRRRRRRRRRR